MRVVAIVGQKGGTGKTTIATGLATAAYLNGAKASIIDLDPQTNASDWFERREAPAPDVASIQPGAIRRTLDAARTLGMDWVFIDTPGKMDSASTEAAKHADLVLIPSQAQIFAVDTLQPLKTLLDMAGNPRAFVVLNMVHPNAKSRVADDAAAITAGYGIEVAPVHLSMRSAFGEAPALGKTPQETEPHGRAAHELAALFRFLEAQESMIAEKHERIKA